MSQLTLAQRYGIQYCLSQNMSYSDIGDHIGKNKSVISREVSRNADERNKLYKAELAHLKAQKRHKEKRKHKRFTNSIEEYVKSQLSKDYSPEQIVGRAELDSRSCVSHERIYQYIWEDKKQGGTLYKHLRNQGKRYRKRGSAKDNRGIIKGRVSIDQRPDIVELKNRIGDLEIDLVIGKGHNQALLTINDRSSGLLFMDKVQSKEASEIQQKTIALLADWKPLIHTITSDNGKEFANHFEIAEQLNLDFYFAKPYHSWQRGANENLNGLVRQYFPKTMSFAKITKKDILVVQNILNNRPRKRFGFKSPNEIFVEKLDSQTSVAFIT